MYVLRYSFGWIIDNDFRWNKYSINWV